MIPKKIHYCWFGRGSLTDLNKRCIDSWAKLMPDFEIKCWDETNSDLTIEYCRAAHAQKRWSRLSNYIRYRALYDEGGIYFDTDVEVVALFNTLLNHSCFLGFQAITDQREWVNTAIIGSVPTHEILRKCLERIEDIFEKTGEFEIGPATATAVLREFGLERYGEQTLDGVTLFPVDYFYPFPWDKGLYEGRMTDNTFCIHHWEGSWLEKPKNRSFARRVVSRAARAVGARWRTS